MKKKILSVLLLLTLLLSSVSIGVFSQDTEAELPFSDVSSGKWFFTAVSRVYYEGIMNGVDDHTFAPNNKMSRAQLVTIICRLSGDSFEGLGKTVDFSDTKTDAWYADYLGWAVGEGVINGYPDGTFRPNNPVSRAEFAAVYARFFEKKEIYFRDAPLVEKFTDEDKIAEWAKPSVELIRRYGIIAGDNAGNFNPTSSASRAEIAMMITRYLDAERMSKLEYLINHIMEYLPKDEQFAALNFSVSGELCSRGFSLRIIPLLGLDEERYEVVAKEDELVSVKEAWVIHDAGEKVIAVLNLALKDNETGEITETKRIRFRLLKTTDPVDVSKYVDPDIFDPGIEPDLYGEMFDKALSNSNNTAKLYLKLKRGMETGKLNVSFIGGSITAGSGASLAGYADISTAWLKRHVAPELEYFNGAMGGTNSTLGAARFERDVLSHDPDIVFIEYAVNDDPGNINYYMAKDSFESMVRTALSYESDPAVVIVICHGGQGNIEFMNGIADAYDVPVVSIAAAVDYALEKGVIDDAEFRPDGCHPSDMGHQISSDMIEELYRRTMDEWDSSEKAEASLGAVPLETVTGAHFCGMKLTDAEDLDITSMGSFSFLGIDDKGISRSATSRAGSENEPLVFTVTGKSVDLIIERGSAFEITVDGGTPVITGDEAYAVVISDTEATHVISIKRLYEDSDATLLAIAVN